MSLKGIAQDTVNILERGAYTAPSGREIIIQDSLEKSVKRSQLLSVEELETFLIHRNHPAPKFSTKSR